MGGIGSVDSEGSCILPIEVLSDVAMASAAFSIGYDAKSALEKRVKYARIVEYTPFELLSTILH